MNGSENNLSLEQDQRYPCPECRAGLMQLQFITYFTWLQDDLITVPNFPAWVCDICGRRVDDPEAISWLNALLNPFAGRPVSRRVRAGDHQSGSRSARL